MRPVASRCGHNRRSMVAVLISSTAFYDRVELEMAVAFDRLDQHRDQSSKHLPQTRSAAFPQRNQSFAITLLAIFSRPLVMPSAS
jgi:hypothetical protein